MLLAHDISGPPLYLGVSGTDSFGGDGCSLRTAAAAGSGSSGSGHSVRMRHSYVIDVDSTHPSAMKRPERDSSWS